jgi:hypothetical protein
MRAAQAGGTEMKTNMRSTYSVVLKDTSGKLFRLSNPESRHVPGLGGRLTPFVIISPYDLLENGAVWNNKCLTDAYIRLPLGDGRLSGKIPVSWSHRVATLTAASEQEIRRGGIIEVCVSAASTPGAPATATSAMDLSTCSLSSPAARPSPAPDVPAPVNWTSDGGIIAFGTHLACTTCGGSEPSRRSSEGQPAGTHAHPAVSILPVPSISAGAGNPALDAGQPHCSAMADGPAGLLIPVVVAAPAISIDADTQHIVDAIDAATARVEWAGAAFTAVSGLEMSQTVTARMRDVTAVSRIATVSQAVRTDNRQHGYRVLEDVPSTLFQPSFRSGTDRPPPAAPPRRTSPALAAHGRVTRPPAAAPASRPEYRLCACPAASLGHGCVGTRVSGSDLCVACQKCTPTECQCRCCGHLDDAAALEAPEGAMDTSDVSAVSHIAAVSQAVRTNHRQQGYRVLEDVPSTLFQPSFQSGTDRPPPAAPPRRPSHALAAPGSVTRPPAAAPASRPAQVPVRRLELAASAPQVAAASPQVLHRLTPDACVYDAATLHAIFGHNVGAKLRDTVNLCTGFRMRRADGTIVMAPFVELADVKLPHQCSICTCTQMQDAGSRHTAQARSAAAAPIAAFAVPLRT